MLADYINLWVGIEIFLLIPEDSKWFPSANCAKSLNKGLSSKILIISPKCLSGLKIPFIFRTPLALILWWLWMMLSKLLHKDPEWKLLWKGLAGGLIEIYQLIKTHKDKIFFLLFKVALILNWEKDVYKNLFLIQIGFFNKKCLKIWYLNYYY